MKHVCVMLVILELHVKVWISFMIKNNQFRKRSSNNNIELSITIRYYHRWCSRWYFIDSNCRLNHIFYLETKSKKKILEIFRLNFNRSNNTTNGTGCCTCFIWFIIIPTKFLWNLDRNSELSLIWWVIIKNVSLWNWYWMQLVIMMCQFKWIRVQDEEMIEKSFWRFFSMK